MEITKMAGMKYRDDMTPAETDQLLAEVRAEDEAYAREPAEGDCCMADHAAAVPPWTCPCPCHRVTEEEADAIVESSGEYFDRYIAGDRR
jgi:hypothetical protein